MPMQFHVQDDPRFADGRVPAHAASVEFVERVQNPSSAGLLHKESVPETHPQSLFWGTREAVVRGGKNLFAALEKGRRKPDIALEGNAFQAKPSAMSGGNSSRSNATSCRMVRKSRERPEKELCRGQ